MGFYAFVIAFCRPNLLLLFVGLNFLVLWGKNLFFYAYLLKPTPI